MVFVCLYMEVICPNKVKYRIVFRRFLRSVSKFNVYIFLVLYFHRKDYNQLESCSFDGNYVTSYVCKQTFWYSVNVALYSFISKLIFYEDLRRRTVLTQVMEFLCKMFSFADAEICFSACRYHRKLESVSVYFFVLLFLSVGTNYSKYNTSKKIEQIEHLHIVLISISILVCARKR